MFFVKTSSTLNEEIKTVQEFDFIFPSPSKNEVCNEISMRCWLEIILWLFHLISFAWLFRRKANEVKKKKKKKRKIRWNVLHELLRGIWFVNIVSITITKSMAHLLLKSLHIIMITSLSLPVRQTRNRAEAADRESRERKQK